MPRPRLLRRLRTSSARRLWVHGPPGSGKTTLITHHAVLSSVPVVWCSLGPEDNVLEVFLEKFARAACKAGLSPGAGCAWPGLTTLSRQFVLVIERCEWLNPDGAVCEWLLELCETLLPTNQLLLVSRTAPFPCFHRLLANRQLATLDWSELRLTLDETQQLLRQLRQSNIARQEATVLHARFDGWVGGLLLDHVRQPKDSRAPHVRTATDSVYAYFEYEVLHALDAQEQQGLAACAWLHALTERSVGALPCAQANMRLVKRIAHRGLFIHEDQRTGAFRIHPLLREVLRSKGLELLGPTQLTATVECAVAIAESSLALDDAVTICASGLQPGRLRELIKRHAPNLLARGDLESVRNWLQELPDPLIETDPELLYLRGHCRLPRDPLAAALDFERAYKQFSHAHEREGLMLSWAGVIGTHLLHCPWPTQDDLKRLQPWRARYEEVIEPALDAVGVSVAHEVLSAVLLVWGTHDPRDPCVIRARTRARALLHCECDDSASIRTRIALTRLQALGGEFDAAKLSVRDWDCQLDTVSMPILTRLIALTAQATHLLLCNERDACVEVVEIGISATQGSEAKAWERLLLCHAAAACINAGDTEQGHAYLARARRSDRGRLRLLEAYWAVLSLWTQRNTPSVAVTLNHALETTQLCQQAAWHFRIFTAVSTAHILDQVDCVSEALRCAHSALEQTRAAGDIYGEWVAMATVAYLQWRLTGLPPLETIRAVFSSSQEHGFQHYYLWPARAFSVLCAIALDHDLYPDCARHLIFTHHTLPPTDYITSEAWPYPVRIFTLGEFRLDASSWRYPCERKVPRVRLKVLKALIALGSQQVPKAVLARNVWPTRTGGRLKALQSELNRLRKMLGEGMISTEGPNVSLNREGVWTDIDYLQRLAAHGCDAERLRKEHQRLAQGLFLPEEDMAAVLHRRNELEMLLARSLAQPQAECGAPAPSHAGVSGLITSPAKRRPRPGAPARTAPSR